MNTRHPSSGEHHVSAQPAVRGKRGVVYAVPEPSGVS